MSEWKPGWVETMHGMWVRLEKDQHWKHSPAPGVTTSLHYEILALDVVAASPSGEVALRVLDRAAFDRIYPLRETTQKGKPITARQGCPFVEVDERMAKNSGGAYGVGDVLCHEAWSVWNRSMWLST